VGNASTTARHGQRDNTLLSLQRRPFNLSLGNSKAHRESRTLGSARYRTTSVAGLHNSGAESVHGRSRCDVVGVLSAQRSP